MTDASRLSFFLSPANWPLFYHTAVNMRPRQLAGVVERKLRHAVVPRVPYDFDGRYERAVPPSPSASTAAFRSNSSTLRTTLGRDHRAECRERAAEAAVGRVTLVGDTRTVTGRDGVEWDSETVTRPPDLWREQFHGFQFLRWPVFGHETPSSCGWDPRTFSQWILDWHRSPSTRVGNEAYLRRAWTPYSVSLRVLNWCRYYAWAAAEMSPQADRTFRRCIFKNALFLTNHIEEDVGGNHLVENGAALVAAGLLFEDEPQGWAETGVEILSRASDQFLDDGGHFERSPMYHVLVLTRYLTVVDLLRKSGRHCPRSIVETAASATEFLRAIRPPDGRIPLFNDSVFDQALRIRECLTYAERVGIAPDDPTETTADANTESGYYWLGEGASRLLVDGGDGGPPHLPGHTHNDPFSFLLWVDGVRLLTDTGVYDYRPTARRQHARSVRAHNTVQIGTTEPVDIGGRYLAGRRLDPTVSYARTDGVTVFEGRYSKRSGRGPDYEHCRRVAAGDRWWLVDDRVEAPEGRPFVGRFHCHPDVVVENDGPSESLALSSSDSGVIARAHSLTGSFECDTSQYFPAFGTEYERTVFSHGTEGSGRLSVLFTPEPLRSVEVERIGWRPTELRLNGERRKIPTDTRT